jgi:hypothetical protein
MRGVGLALQSASKMVQIGEVGERLEEWLEAEGFNVWKFADDDSRFSFKVTRDECPPLLVLQPQSKVDSLLVRCDVRLADKGQEKLLALPEKEREFMLFDLRMVLLSTECRCQFVPSSRSWKAIRVSKPVFYDGLTKDRFFETVDTVARAVSLVTLTFQWKFGVTPYVS